jgi:hypothetical protein
MKALLLIAILLSAGCSDADFEGQNAQTGTDNSSNTNNGGQDNETENTDDAIGDGNGSGSNGLNTGGGQSNNGGSLDFDGNSIRDCSKNPSDQGGETETFGGARFDAHSFRELINANCQSGILRTGTIHGDQLSADVLCRLKGFEKAESFLTQAYDSPGNNEVATFTSSGNGVTDVSLEGSFKIQVAAFSNIFVTGITCVNAVAEECKQDDKKFKLKCDF